MAPKLIILIKHLMNFLFLSVVLMILYVEQDVNLASCSGLKIEKLRKICLIVGTNCFAVRMEWVKIVYMMKNAVILQRCLKLVNDTKSQKSSNRRKTSVSQL